MRVERQNESLREVLFSHKTFSVHEAFTAFDFNSSGDLDANDLAEGFLKHDCPMDAYMADKVVTIMDDDDDNTIDLREFAKAVTPQNPEYRRAAQVGSLTFEQKYLYT
jgi:Ca2+-binding EF-hand superfamily protein